MQKQNGSTNNSMDCEWRWVVGFEGRYMVSNTGLVARCLKPTVKPGKVGNHLQVSLTDVPNSHKKVFVHRLVLEAFVGPCPEGAVTCHENDNGTDNRLENLRWDTRSANGYDAWRNARKRQIGKRALSIKETEARHHRVAALLAQGLSVAAVAKKEKTSKRTVATIARSQGILCRCGHVFGDHNLSCHCGCPRFRAQIHQKENKARGVSHPSVKITEAQAKAVKQKIAQGESQRKIAKEFGVSRSAIRAIQSGHSWGWIE